MGSSTRPGGAIHPGLLAGVVVAFPVVVLGLASWGGWVGVAGIGVVLAAMVAFTVWIDEPPPRHRGRRGPETREHQDEVSGGPAG